MTGTTETNSSASLTAGSDASRCPLCGESNDCRLCSAAAYKGPCWCEAVQIPEALLARIPTEQRNLACICRACVAGFHRVQTLPVVPGDFYFDADGMMVFTAAYHLRRGQCCGNACRHCPFPRKGT